MSLRCNSYSANVMFRRFQLAPPPGFVHRPSLHGLAILQLHGNNMEQQS